MEEYPFRFLNTPSSLQHLASSELALTLWRYEYANLGYSRAFESFFPAYPSSCEGMLALPSRMEIEIYEKIETIRRGLKNWIGLHSIKGVFERGIEAALPKCFKHIVISCLGTISLKATAMNILDSGEFSNVENYKIACTLCLEDQVRRFWPAVAEDARVRENVTTDENKLITYWNLRMKSMVNSIEDPELIKTQLEISLSECNWLSFEYFWKMLLDQERASQTVSFRNSAWDEAVIRSLPTLNRIQVEKVFEEKVAGILHNLIHDDKYLPYLSQLWTVVGHTVFKNESSFCRVLLELWSMVLKRYNFRGEEVNRSLLEIWSNAPDELKVSVSNLRVGEFLKEIPYDGIYRPYDMTFVLNLLKKSRNVNREELLRVNWHKLTLWAEPSCLEPFIKVCVPDDSTVELFKKHSFQHSEGPPFSRRM